MKWIAALAAFSPDLRPHIVCIGRCYFATLGRVPAGVCGTQAAELAADIPNYTDAEVVLQVSETT